MEYLLPFVREVFLGNQISRKLILRHGCLDYVLNDEVKRMLNSPEKVRALKEKLRLFAVEYQKVCGQNFQLEKMQNTIRFLEKSEMALKQYRYMLN